MSAHRTPEESPSYLPVRAVVAGLSAAALVSTCIAYHNQAPQDSSEVTNELSSGAAGAVDSIDVESNTIQILSSETVKTTNPFDLRTMLTGTEAPVSSTAPSNTSVSLEILPSLTPSSTEQAPPQPTREGFLGLEPIPAAPPLRQIVFAKDGSVLGDWSIVPEGYIYVTPDYPVMDPSVGLTPGDNRAVWITESGMPNTEKRQTDQLSRQVIEPQDNITITAFHASDSSNPAYALSGQNMTVANLSNNDSLLVTVTANGVFVSPQEQVMEVAKIGEFEQEIIKIADASTARGRQLLSTCKPYNPNVDAYPENTLTTYVLANALPVNELGIDALTASASDMYAVSQDMLR